MKHFIVTILILLAAFAAFGQQDLPVLTDAPVGPRDVLQIKVLEEPSVDVARVTIGDDGTITLALIGKVEVAGLSPRAIENRLKSLLEAKFVNKATVSVQIVEYGNRPISVLGAVTHPGRIGATSSMTLIQAITHAGGLSANSGRELYVLRTADNGLTEKISIDVEELMINGNPDLNLPLAPNDVINVPIDTPMTVYVLGEVMRPGKVQFRRSQNPTLLQALAEAGGPTDRAGRSVTIRRVVNGKETTQSVNWRQITTGKKPDIRLQDNDTLYLKESIF